MSDSQNGGFGKFVPGFDFLQNLAKSASQTVPQMPNMSNWIAPTMSVEELEKRIDELKAVHFWLDQNSKALAATIQALEVQKMTLATLKGMNFNLGDIANAFKLKAADTVYSSVQKVTEKAASTAESVADAARQTEELAKKVGDAAKPAIAGLVDPMHLWSSLTQQFQTIAASAMKEASKTTAMDAAMDMGKNLAKELTQGVVNETKKATDRIAASASMAGVTAKKEPAKTATKTADKAPVKAAAKKAAAKAAPGSR